MTFSSGEYLYHNGDIPSKALTIHEGWVILFQILEDGSRQILRFALAGDLLSYKTGKDKPIDHSAIAVTEVTVCSFPINGFKDTIAKLPELFFAISSITNILTSRCYSTLTSIAKKMQKQSCLFTIKSAHPRRLTGS